MKVPRSRPCFALVLALGSVSPAIAQELDGEEPPLREQTVYIPYTKLRETFEKQDRGVFLPYGKFLELWNAARDKPVRDPRERLPVGSLITEIASEATVAHEVVEVTAHLKIDLMAEGWHEIPLRLADSAVRSARLGDEPARLVTGPEGDYRLLVEKRGKAPEQIELLLEYAKSFTKSPGQNSVSFQAPLAPVNRWRIRIPQSGVKVNVHPLLAATEVPAGGDANGAEQTVALAFVGAAPLVRIDWTAKSEGAAGLAALASVQVEQEVTVEEGVIRIRAHLAYDISRAELGTLVIEVPADQKVAGVFDANVRQWEVAAEGDVQRITVQLFEPAREKQNVTVELEKYSEEDGQREIEVPVVRAAGVSRQQGLVVVQLAADLRGEAIRREGLLQLDPAEMPRRLAGRPWTFSYRYAALPFDLALKVEKVSPRIQVNQLVEAYLEPEKLSVDLLALYDIQRAGIFELQLDIPSGYEVRQVRGEGCSGAQPAAVDSYHLEGDGKFRLLVNLSRKATGCVGLLVQLERRLDDVNLLSPTGQSSDVAVALPGVAPSSVERSTGRLIVYAPESLRMTPERHDRLRSVSFQEALEGITSMRGQRFPELRPILAFAYVETPGELTVAAERRKPHVTARQLLVSRVDSGVVKYDSTIYYDILYSGVKSLRIDVPQSIAGKIHNNTTTLRESTIDPPPDDVVEGDVAWSLTGQSELIGSVAVHLSWEQPIEKLDVGGSVDLDIPRLRPRGVDRAWGQIVLVKAESIDVRPQGTPQGLRPIDPQHDLMPGASVPDAAAAMEFHNDWTLTLTATRYRLESVKQTSIERAVVRMVATRSDQVAVQALYRLRSNRQRLEVKLPDSVAPGKVQFDTDPLRINGQPITLERGSDDRTFYVPLVGHSNNEALVLELRYTAPGSARRLELPAFPGEPAVQKVYLCAYLPEEFALVGSRGEWTDEMVWRNRRLMDQSPVPRRQDSELIAWVTEGVAMATNPAETFALDGKLYLYSALRPEPESAAALRLVTLHENWLHGLVFASIALIGVVLVRRSFAARLLMAGGLIIFLVLLGVFFTTLAHQIFDGVLASAILLVGLVWLIAAAIHLFPRRAAMSESPPVPAEVVAEGGEHHA